ncbi:hypothetical protein SteCoe_5095 [Stentor coeruleus]|uniref:Uncharacterized protein n=1 Tax=Stentor coeruleus TaxID=5963 RepID=A0A1R2CTA9_9CILI|nr:hypothetical protein SteCoe_5095 [Stentor coeruleus]
MDLNSFSSWSSQPCAQEPKAKISHFPSRSKKASLENFKESLLSSLYTIKPQQTKLSKAYNSASNFNQYQNMKDFRTTSGYKTRNSPSNDIGKLNKIPSYEYFDKVVRRKNNYTLPSEERKEDKEKLFFGYKRDDNRREYCFTEREKDYRFNNYRDDREKRYENIGLNEVIGIGVLYRATGVVKKQGLNDLPLNYKNQLKEFCNEVLSQSSN